MASYLDNTKVNTAITENTKMDLGHSHITTTDFMQLQPVYMKEMVPGEKIDINMESFARLNPLPVPTFGRASMRNRAFFVPFRTIFRGWNDFITDSVHIASDGQGNNTILSTVPTISSVALADVFRNSIGTTSTDAAGLYPSPSLTTYDVSWTGAGSYYDFTVQGRQWIKLIESLGYKVDWDASSSNIQYFSALPFLALARIYCDYYFPQTYTNLYLYDALLSMCNYDVNAGPLQMTAAQLRVLLTVCSFVQYDSDYFVSAFDLPNQPNAGTYSDFKLVNLDTVERARGILSNTTGEYIYSEPGYVSNNSGSTAIGNRIGGANAPFITPYVSGAAASNGNYQGMVTPISEYLLHSLHALTDYMKRHQLAGSKNFERYLARFGKAIPAEKLNRSLYLGGAYQNIQIGDIMSTADTVASGSGSQLGAFAGKGMSYGNGHFTCNTDEFGYIFILSSIVPSTGYFQGIDRQVMRTSKLQFWTPEFDSLGTQPITAAELFIPQIASQMTGDPYEQIFGFTPRYADYKVSHDQLTGNFRLLSLNGGSTINAANSWHLMRTFDSTDSFAGAYTNVVHNPNFLTGVSDCSQYKRIFYDKDPDAPDNMTVIHNFEIASYAPMKALYDTYEFEDKGKQVTLEVNGVKMN